MFVTLRSFNVLMKQILTKKQMVEILKFRRKLEKNVKVYINNWETLT